MLSIKEMTPEERHGRKKQLLLVVELRRELKSKMVIKKEKLLELGSRLLDLSDEEFDQYPILEEDLRQGQFLLEEIGRLTD